MPELKNDLDRMSYALALNMATSIRHMPVKLNYELFGESVLELLKGGAPAISQAEYREYMQKLQDALAEAEQASNADSAAALEEEKAFMEKNGKAEGVITTASGLQYQILTAGKGGERPGPKDVVRVHYEGKLLSGKVFDSSIARGEPIEFPVDQVIPGWTEALQLMEIGSKFRLFIPSKLGYGAHGAGSVIPPNATLIFEVELIGFFKN
ncbi:MAG: FKBP-type peptidyl-prolyl cis-trans isomerase [Lentisphaerae bacterium]|nr:FKBP-type peptidyl-prolyl cis-trans isomerase [Lentisphaerota bacterium]